MRGREKLGVTSPYDTYLVMKSGYQSAVGLGGRYQHVREARFYLSRIEVQGEFKPGEFAGHLPWGEPQEQVEEHKSIR